jgi:hypothetical protein
LRRWVPEPLPASRFLQHNTCSRPSCSSAPLAAGTDNTTSHSAAFHSHTQPDILCLQKRACRAPPGTRFLNWGSRAPF